MAELNFGELLDGLSVSFFFLWLKALFLFFH